MKKKKFVPSEDSEPLDAEEWALLRGGEDRSKLPPHDTSDRAHVFRFARKNKVVSVSVIVIAAILLFGLILGGILLFHALFAPTDTQLQKGDTITLRFGEDEPLEFDYDELVREGVFYVNLWDFADYFDLTVSGSQSRLRFTADDGESYLLLENGDEYAFINGRRILLEAVPVLGGEEVIAPALVDGKTCLIPYEILKNAVSDGFSFKLDSQHNLLQIRPIMNMVDDKKENAVRADICFTADPFQEVIFPMDKENIVYEYSYPIDIDPYLPSITAEHLVLANKSNALGKDYDPTDLVELTCTVANPARTYELRQDAANALYAMLAAMAADGIDDVYVTSAYRSFDYQNTLYEGYVKKHMSEGMSRSEAEAKASTYSSRPGESEHQTGLCLDFTAKSVGGSLDESFETTPAFAWLSENAWQYGFILRYPKSAEQIAMTGYDYEPWHYRFVGRYASSEIYHEGVTLEEYLGAVE